MRLAFFFALLLPLAAFAQSAPVSVLGGTLEQCIAKYGPATKQKADPKAISQSVYSFSKGGFNIQIQFLGDHVATVGYSSPNPIPDADIVALLENHAQGSTWNTAPGDNARERAVGIFRRYESYFRTDQGAFAEYEEIGTVNMLFVVNAEFKKLQKGRTSSVKDL